MWLQRLNDWVGAGRPCALVTIVAAEGSTPRGPGAKMAVDADGEVAGTVGGGAVEHHCVGAALEAIRSGEPRLVRFVLDGGTWAEEAPQADYGVCGGAVTLFIEPVPALMEVVIFGAGHVGESVGRLCAALGVPYRVYDDRPGFPTPERFPDARETVLGPYADLPARIRLGASSWCVILTEGHAHDETVLAHLLGNPDLPYIGMIGSRAKVGHSFAKVRALGAPPDPRVYSPIGLGLGGRAPADIALAILAEIRCLHFAGHGGHLRVAPEAMDA